MRPVHVVKSLVTASLGQRSRCSQLLCRDVGYGEATCPHSQNNLKSYLSMQLVSIFRSSCSAQLSGETSRSRTEAGAEALKGGFDVPERVCALRDRVELPITTEWVGCVRKVKSGGIEASIPPGKVLGTYHLPCRSCQGGQLPTGMQVYTYVDSKRDMCTNRSLLNRKPAITGVQQTKTSTPCAHA